MDDDAIALLRRVYSNHVKIKQAVAAEDHMTFCELTTNRDVLFKNVKKFLRDNAPVSKEAEAV